MRIFPCSQRRSATFVAVTDPNRAPVGPAFASKRSSSFSIRSAIARASSTDFASWRGGRAAGLSSLRAGRRGAGPRRGALLELADERRRRGLGEPARQEKVARIATRHVDDLATKAEVV